MDNFEMSSSVLELSEHKTYLELTRRSCYYNYPNGNHVQLNSDNAEEMAETLVNQPVVAKYKKIAGKDDLGGHECSVDKDGNVKFGTATIGVNTAVEVKDDDVTLYSGETVNTPCLFVTSRIWKRNSSVCDAIKRLFSLGQLHSSWEILSEKTEMVDGVKVLKKYLFESDCLLGSRTTPAYGDCAETLCMASLDEESPEMLIAEALANDIYNTEAKEDIMTKTQETAEEKVVETPTEASEVKVENTDTPIAEVSENETSESENKEKAEKTENTSEVETETKNEETSEKDATKEETETSALTDWDLRKKIGEAARKIYRWFYVCFMFPAENYVLGKTDEGDENDLDYVKFTYTVNGDEVTIGEPEKVTLSVSVAEINSTIAEKDNAIVKANEEIQTLKAENEKLLSYKERCDREDAEKVENEISEKKEALKKYALDSKQISEAELETDGFKKIISELDEVALKAIISDRVVASLSKESNKETKVETSEVKTEQPKANLETAEDNKIDVDGIIKSFLRK
jgi:hypothetical protein